ncbi:MAG: transcriptional repressor [Candidatus Eisenbacteria bacterium]|nr:transcriptional repressor [Candidatus Eisenbacteria bacterium]
MRDILLTLRACRIPATPQRMAVAEWVLRTTAHPCADEVWEAIQRTLPTVSRATVYNTLNLFVRKGLLRTQVLKGGTVVFDPRVEPHHHFIDEETGRIYDVPWNAVRVTGAGLLRGFRVREYQVVMRGRRRRRTP